MKCSLLTLSTFIDGELAPERSTEVDAHLVGCPRCSSGAATLREERTRVGQLARVTVDPGSAQLMLEQVGIIIDPAAELPPTISSSPSGPTDDGLPWQSGGTASPSLPWTPRRPDGVALPPAPALPSDAPAELDLEGLRSAPPSWERATPPQLAIPVQGALEPPPGPPMAEAGRADTDDEWLDAVLPPASPEAHTEAPADPFIGAAALLEPPAPPTVAPGFPPPAAPPPQRVAGAAGPAALWTRLRDAVNVRMALARGGDGLEDSAQIVSGAAPPRGAELPVLPPPVVPAEVELDGVAEPPPHRPATDAASLPERDAGPSLTAAPAPRSAVADARGAYGGVAPSPRPARPLGRHSRAVAREQTPLAARLGRGVRGLLTAVAAAAVTGSTWARQRLGRAVSAGPDSRLVAGIAGVGLIFVVALLIGHTSSSRQPAPASAVRPPTSAATLPKQTAGAQSSAAASATGPAAPQHTQTFGAGDTGFQVVRLRYGAQVAYLRVVFDMGAVSGAPTGTPAATVSFANPTTMLVTFTGTLPAGSTGTPPPGKVISAVTLVSSGGDRTVYRFTLSRAATATAFYLVSPTRFVLDLR